MRHAEAARRWWRQRRYLTAVRQEELRLGAPLAFSGGRAPAPVGSSSAVAPFCRRSFRRSRSSARAGACFAARARTSASASMSPCAVAGGVGERGDGDGIPADRLGFLEVAAAREDPGTGAAPPGTARGRPMRARPSRPAPPRFRGVGVAAVEQQVRRVDRPRAGVRRAAGDLQRLDARPRFGFGRDVIARHRLDVGE